MTPDDERAHERRLWHMASGDHEGPLTPEDLAALKWAYEVYTAARPASKKLWTMYVRGEVAARAELDTLVDLFNDESPWAARARLLKGGKP